MSEQIASRRLYRVLLGLLPRALREQYGAEMEMVFLERLRDASGPLARCGVWTRGFADLVGVAVSERRPRSAKGPRPSLATMLTDVRYACRTLARRSAHSAAIIGIVALGVGANTAIFSVVSAAMLKPLPYRNANELVQFRHEAPQLLTSLPEYVDYSRNLGSFASLAAYTRSEATLLSGGDPDRIRVASVTQNLFKVLGSRPAHGRGFSDDDDLTNGGVVILSDGLWRRRFGADRGMIGRTIVLNGRPRTVIGIMASSFQYPAAHTDAWLPQPRVNLDSLGDRAYHHLEMVGRLRPGLSAMQATSEARAYALRMMSDNVGRYDPQHPPVPIINTIREDLIGDARPYLWSMLGAAGFVLLMICTNVASLLIARGEARITEMALRSALGADRNRLITQLLAEALVLSCAGGALGLLVALAATRGLVTLAPAGFPRIDETGIDWRVLLYALAASLIAGLAFGVLPALRASRHMPIDALRKARRNGAQHSSRRVRRTLVVAEVALAVVMLTGAGMLLRSLSNLQRTDLGFRIDGGFTATVSPPPSSYDTTATTLFYATLLERLRALPGVSSAAAAAWLPIVDSRSPWGILADGQSYDNLDEAPTAVPQQVTPGYFAAMGISLLRGRDFSDADRSAGPYVAIVSKSLADALWPSTDPIGKRFRVGGGNTFVSVIGIAADVRARGFAEPPERTMYFPHAQTAVTAYAMPRSMSIILRMTQTPTSYERAVRTIVHAIDPSVPVSSVRTMEEIAGESIAARRFTTALIAGFAALALTLAAVGIFGVISYGVHERSFEIGVRMALGAGRSSALFLVVQDSMVMALLGIAAGLAAAAAVARTIRSLLVDVGVIDVTTWIVVSLGILLVAGIATIIPAMRATRINPVDAMR